MVLMLGLAMQAAVVAVTPSIACSVVDARPANAPVGGAGLLVAGCGTHGVTLGSASRYSAVWSPVANSLLVMRRQGAKNQVLLISSARNGAGVAVDDVTRELTELGGNSPKLGLRSAAIDSTRFAIDGTVGVSVAGSSRRLDLKPYAARARQMAPSASEAAASTN